jgi:predicted enzyme related to lactoylglutathione lyase
MIKGVNQVVIAVKDQSAAKEFWVNQVGFDLVKDESYGDERWIEVVPPNGSPVLVLALRTPEEPRPAVSDQLPHSNVFFTCDDLEQTYQELTDRGVKFPTPPMQMPFGWWSMFADGEGTRFALGQAG